MQSQARVVIIGGGIAGCSVLYHLAKLGWTDLVLLEKGELTAGSTWHAAGNMSTNNSVPNLSRMQAYSIRLYAELEEETGQSVGLHQGGGLFLATTGALLDSCDRLRYGVTHQHSETSITLRGGGRLSPDELREQCL